MKNIKLLYPLIFSVTVVSLYLIFVQNIFLIEKAESSGIGTNTFSIQYFFRLAPIFLAALIKFKWFGLYIYILIISFNYFIFNFKNYPKLTSMVLLFLGFFLIYTVHYRSYYFVHFDDVDPFEALRYLNNFFIISILPISSFIVIFITKLKLKKLYVYPLIIILFISFYNTFLLRSEFSKMEIEDRFSKPIEIIEFIDSEPESFIITENILIFQLLGNEKLKVIDLMFFPSFNEMMKDKKKYLFVTKDTQSESYRYRFPEIFDSLEKFNKKEVKRFNNESVLYELE